MHHAIEPAIHYWGTPVVLVSSLDADGSTNLAPMSSAWWLGWSCMLGLDASSATVANLRRDGRCVLNLPSQEQDAHVNALALTTGSVELPLHKRMLDYRHVADKFAAAGLTRAAHTTDGHPRAALECPVHLEGEVVAITPFGTADPRLGVPVVAVEVRLTRVMVDERLSTPGRPDRIDAEAWHPLLMSFRHLYGRGGRRAPSVLASGPEEAYAPWKFARA